MLRTALVAVACTGVVIVTVGAPVDALAATPHGLRATSATPTTLTLRWRPVSHARAYRVQVAGSRSMQGATYRTFRTNTGRVTHLQPHRRYYFRVAVARLSGKRIGPYTARPYPSAVTAAVAVPRGLRVTGAGPASLGLAWTASEGATRYRVEASTSPTFDAVVSALTASAATTLSGLASQTSYYVRAQVVRLDGTALTGWSPALSAVTAAPEPPPVDGPVDLRVASFNVVSVTLDTTTGEERPWAQRRPQIISQIMREKVDVLGTQEANMGHNWTSRLVDGATQFLDLKNGLNTAGGHYALTNEYSFNCVNPNTEYKCVHQDRSASNSTRILYDTDTVRLVSQGALRYTTQVAGRPDSYLAYAVLRAKANGREFLFTDTHLTPAAIEVRRSQWTQLIAKVNAMKGDLPVINVGDYNTNKFDPLSAEMLPAMTSAGYGDVLNQAYTVNPARNPRALTITNGWINSLNRFTRDVSTFAYEDQRDKTGNNIDWVFATNSLVVKEWKVVVDFDPATLQVTGVIPSDHNMVRATVVLP